MQQPYSNTACHCELAERCLFFETSQPCVSTTVTLSHRFKSSPSIPGKVKMPDAAGYLMNAGYFRENLESSGDLNRPRESRGSQPSACFCGTFCTTQKVTTRSLCREHRGSANLDSARRNGDFALTKLKPFPKKASRFSKPRISAPKPKLRTSPIKSFAAPRLISALRRCHVAAATFFAALRRLLFPTFCKVQKVGQKTL